MLHVSKLFLGAKIKSDYSTLYYVLSISAKEVIVRSASKSEGHFYLDRIPVSDGYLPSDFSNTVYHEVPLRSGTKEYCSSYADLTHEAEQRYGLPYEWAGGVFPIMVEHPFNPYDPRHMLLPFLSDL